MSSTTSYGSNKTLEELKAYFSPNMVLRISGSNKTLEELKDLQNV